MTSLPPRESLAMPRNRFGAAGRKLRFTPPPQGEDHVPALRLFGVASRPGDDVIDIGGRRRESHVVGEPGQEHVGR